MEGHFYLSEFPSVGDLVVAEMTKFENSIIDVSLSEFPDKTGQVFVKNMRLKKIREIVKIGQQSVFKVLEVDAARGYIDLDVSYVDDADRKSALDRFKVFKQLRTAIYAIALRYGLDQQQISQAYLGLMKRVIADRSLSELTPSFMTGEMLSFEPQSEVESEAQREFRRKAVPSLYHVEGEMLLNCFNVDGVDAIKDILGRQLAQILKGHEGLDLDVVMAKSPSYLVLAKCDDPEKGLKAVDELMKRIGAEFATTDGRRRFKINRPAKIVGDDPPK